MIELSKMDAEDIYDIPAPQPIKEPQVYQPSILRENNQKKRCPISCLLLMSSLTLVCSLATTAIALYVASSGQSSPSKLATSGSSFLSNPCQEIDALAQMVHNISYQQSRIANENRDYQARDTIHLSNEVQNLSLQIKSSIHTQNQQLQSKLESVQQLLYSSVSTLQANSSMLADQMNILSNEIERVSCLSGTFRNTAGSCKNVPPYCPSAYYWITNSTNSPVLVYCDMNQTSCSCNATRGWMRVANLDMTDPNQNCPYGFRLVTRTEPPLRTCGRPDKFGGCVSTTYQTHGVEFSHVCGRIIGYQDRTTDAFEGGGRNIDSPYVDGISLTHGQSPRQHIWTFAAALDEVKNNHLVCPCTQPDHPYTGAVPSFVGQDYFCETGSRTNSQWIFYPDDPLWDGQGCGGNSTCCQFNNPPWFCKQLPQPTTNDIELRICGRTDNEDTPLEVVEIYVH